MKTDTNKNKNQWIKKTIIVFVWLIYLFTGAFAAPAMPLHGAAVTLPGDVDRICYYVYFFYNYPSEDFLYYFNDLLLYWEKPDGAVMAGTPRHRLLEVVSWHNAIKEFIRRHTGENINQITFNLSDPTAFKKASDLLVLMGRQLKKNAKGQYYLIRTTHRGVPDYFQFALMREDTLEQQFNRTHFFKFHLKESKVPLPAGLDLEFFQEVSGIPLDASSFFEAVLTQERLSLLLAVLYRLSNNEIQYIDNLVPPSRPGAHDAWKKIYDNKKLLMGLFVLSKAFRVHKLQEDSPSPLLHLPGGKTAEPFWSEMAGVNGANGSPLNPASFEFLERLATKDDGKLNYLYVFSYFLPEDTRKALFFDYDPQKFKEIYNLISLDKEERLNDTVFPRLGDWNFFTLMSILETREGKIYFPQGIDAWYRAVKGQASSDEPASLQGLLGVLLRKPEHTRKFMAIYSKFSLRPGLLAEGNLAKIYNLYDEYNAVVDFIEKIPFKKPETAAKLLDWAQTFEYLQGKDRLLLASIYQSLFEILAFTAKYAPHGFDYDRSISELIAIPLTTSTAQLYHELFRFFQDRLGIDGQVKTLKDVMLTGVVNQTVTPGSEAARYRFLIRDAFGKTIDKICQSQEICSFSHLQKINRLLEQGLRVKPPAASAIGKKIIDAFDLLPHPGMSGDAPRKLRARVNPYPAAKLKNEVKNLVERMQRGADEKELEILINKLKGDYLIYHLREYLLALAYAVNAKDPKIKAFLNPNFVRLHDMDAGGKTLWDGNGSKKIKNSDSFSEYHLSGPLSRLNIGFASRWEMHLFLGRVLHNPAHIQALIANILEFYPLPLVDQSMVYQALLVELGLEMLREARYDKDNVNNSDNETMRQDVIRALGTITSGYHYRKSMEYITGQSNHHNLYLSELKKLGEVFSQDFSQQQREYGARLATLTKLAPFQEPPLADQLKEEMHRFGSIFPHTLDNMIPRKYPVFPQEVANLLASGWFSGSMVDEYKIKLAYHLYKKQIPPCLMGQFLYMYFSKTARQFLHYNHVNDYPTTYLIFNIFNNAHLNGLIKRLKKEGYLRLK
jgi:hypothetical protein